jgi:hypothetical protein
MDVLNSHSCSIVFFINTSSKLLKLLGKFILHLLVFLVELLNLRIQVVRMVFLLLLDCFLELVVGYSFVNFFPNSPHLPFDG